MTWEGMTSEQASVDTAVSSAAADSEMTAVELGARSSLAVAAGVIAATSLLDRAASRDCSTTKCHVDVVVDAPDDCVTPPSHAEGDVHDSSVTGGRDVARSPSPRGRLSPIFNQLRLRGRCPVVGRRHKSAAAAQRCQSWSGHGGRRVAIESALSVDRCCSSERRRCRRADSGRGDHDDVDVPRQCPVQQLATALTSTDVRDGRFSAHLPVDVMPRGDVMIRLRSGRLEVLQSDEDVGDGEGAAAAGRVRRLCGVVELPMYADADSVTVRHDATARCLVIQAAIKGCAAADLRRRSVSLDELWSRPARAHRHGVRGLVMPTWRKREHDNVVILCSETRTGDNHS